MDNKKSNSKLFKKLDNDNQVLLDKLTELKILLDYYKTQYFAVCNVVRELRTELDKIKGEKNNE